MNYSYDNVANLIRRQDARTITTNYTYDAANRPTQVAGVLNGVPSSYALGVTYAPQGAPNYYRHGNSVARTQQFNSRLQPIQLQDAMNGLPNAVLLQLNPGWGSTNNNGTLQSLTETNSGPGYQNPLTFTQNFSYDNVNRLSTATDSGRWSRTQQYDAFGNMWANGTGLPVIGPNSNVYNANNQIGGVSYDAAGNQLAANGDTMTYDAENRQTSATEPPSLGGATETYVYDGSGQRVEKVGPSGTTVYVYDAFSQLVAEYNSGAATSPQCATCYLSADNLGSIRMVTAENANVIGRHDYLPFGEEVPANMVGRNSQWGPGNDAVNQKFTGKERDQETGLDYFGARYYGSALGRFTSPDEFKGGFDNLDGQPAFSPGPIGYADLSDPQTLNMYVYTRNNPLRYIDPDGHDFWDYVSGVSNAFVSDNALGTGRANGGNDDFQVGQMVGDAVATVLGGIEALGGVGGEVGGTALDLTGAGALVGVPTQVASAGLIAQGATTASVAAGHLVTAAVKASDAPGTSASGQATDKYGNKLGPSGDTQINKTRSNTREGARNKALNEGSKAANHNNPKEGQDPHYHPADAQGNKKPNSTHHYYPDN